MLTIWGRTNSINVQKVLWACAEIGVPFRRHDAGGPFGGTDTEGYRAMNPNGLVPTIEDDGFVLWESNAIVRYLARKYGATGFSICRTVECRAVAGNHFAASRGRRFAAEQRLRSSLDRRIGALQQQ